MNSNSSATTISLTPIPASDSARTGLWWGLLGVAAFSLTVPLTSVAVGAFPAMFVGAGRAVVAALLAGAALACTRQRWPRGRQWLRLAVVASGVVAGFPLLTSLALTAVPASHAAVVIGVLPAATAVVTVLRTRERPSAVFWVCSGLGAVAAVTFATLHSGGAASTGWTGWPDAALGGAVLLAAVGYAEGGLLARELGAWQTVSWALVLAFPVMLAVTVASLPGGWTAGVAGATITEWAAFDYLSVVSMFLGFFAWYRGLAIGPMALVSQVQLVQPVLSLLWAAVLLGEVLTVPALLGGSAVILCAGCAVRARISR